MLSILWPERLIRAKKWLKKNEGDLSLAAGVFLGTVFLYLAVEIVLLSQPNRSFSIQPASRAAEDIRPPLPASLAELALPAEGSAAGQQGRGAGESNTRQVAIPDAERHGVFVASKNGKYYYWPDSPWAGRIKPENRVWFSTKEEAESRGYKKSSDFSRFGD